MGAVNTKTFVLLLAQANPLSFVSGIQVNLGDVLRSYRRVLIPDHGHYARVISDVFFDHFLATSFSRYSSETLEEFVNRVFSAMESQPRPGRLAYAYPYIPSWILSYREVEGIRIALTNLSRRLSRRPHLETATHHLIDSREELERCFHEFFSDVVAFAKR